MRLLAIIAIALELTFGCKTSGSEEAVPGEASLAIVTTTPSATEMVAALGLAKSLVGVDQFSEFPPEVIALPKVGDFMTPNLKVIARLQPDVVVMDETQKESAAALEAVGLRVLPIKMHSVDDLKVGLLSLGATLNVSAAADAQVLSIDRALASSSERAAKRKAKFKVLAVVDRDPGEIRAAIVAGPGSYLDQLVTRVGGVNLMSGTSIRYPNVSIATLMRNPPDVIFDASRAGRSDLKDWQKLIGFKQIPAFALKGPVFASPSPRLGEALRTLHGFLDVAETSRASHAYNKVSEAAGAP